MKIYIVLIAVIVIALIGVLAFRKATSPTAKINGHEFSLILAKDEKDKQIGLSKFSKIDKDKGMLFLFDKEDFYPFWMKNMKFPIDIIFIKNDKIVTIYGEVPVPQDKNNLIIYTPTEASDKVLEVRAQTSTKYNFKIGDTVTFKNIK